MVHRFLLIFFALMFGASSFAQTGKATIYGKVRDANTDQAVEVATVYIKGTNTVVETRGDGSYSIQVPSQEPFVLSFSRVGYQEAEYEQSAMPDRSRKEVNVFMVPVDAGIEVVVRESRIEEGGMIREDVSELKLLPTTTGNLESVLPAIALGTSSGTGGELSSQYNVRGATTTRTWYTSTTSRSTGPNSSAPASRKA